MYVLHTASFWHNKLNILRGRRKILLQFFLLCSDTRERKIGTRILRAPRKVDLPALWRSQPLIEALRLTQRAIINASQKALYYRRRKKITAVFLLGSDTASARRVHSHAACLRESRFARAEVLPATRYTLHARCDSAQRCASEGTSLPTRTE